MLKNIRSVDDYFTHFSGEALDKLVLLRETILELLPDEAEEVISYQMPAFKYKGMLVYYAGYAKHIGFYPMPSALQKFKQEISPYKSSKGAVQFPLNEKLPVALIRKMVKFRIQENEEKAKTKAPKK